MLSAENSFFQSHLCQLSDYCLNKMYRLLKIIYLSWGKSQYSKKSMLSNLLLYPRRASNF